MNNNKGITLISLVVMIIVILILVSVATTTGFNVIKEGKYHRAVAEMRAMQTKINELYEDYKGGEDVLNEYGNTISAEIQTQARTAYDAVKGESSDNPHLEIGEWTDFKYYNADYIKDTLDVDGIEGNYIINIKTRTVILLGGIKREGNTIYSLCQIENEQFNVEYVNP